MSEGLLWQRAAAADVSVSSSIVTVEQFFKLNSPARLGGKLFQGGTARLDLQRTSFSGVFLSPKHRCGRKREGWKRE